MSDAPRTPLVERIVPGSTRTPRRVPLAVCAVVGIASAAVGLLPWLATGMRLPLQNLWAHATPAEEMPIALLPFSQYAITLIIGLIVVGSATAGIVARALGRRMPRAGAMLVLAGALAVQVTAVVQTAVVVSDGLQERSESDLYVVLLVGVASLAILVGVCAMILIAVAPRAGATVGLSVGALATGPWFSGILNPLGGVPGGTAVTLLQASVWIPPVLVGAAIAWGGVNTVGRVAAACGALLLVWIVPALTTAISSAAGTRVLAGEPAEMRDYGLRIFAAAATVPELALRPILLAVGVAVAGTVVGMVAGRARRGH